MSTNDIQQTSTPIADNCDPLRTKSGQEIDPHERATVEECRCPDCGEPVPTMFEHVDGCPGETPPAPAAQCKRCGRETRSPDRCRVCEQEDNVAERPTPRGESDGPGCPVSAMRPAERPTPITDRLQIAYRKAWSERNEKGAVDELLISHADLERQLAEAREELNEWKTLQGWGGTPEAINAFIQGQQSRIHAAQDIEAQLAAAIRERDNALSDWRQADSDTVRALHERNEAREQRDRLAELAGELIAMIRVNVMRDTFREATIEQVDAHLEPWIKRLHAVKETQG